MRAFRAFASHLKWLISLGALLAEIPLAVASEAYLRLGVGAGPSANGGATEAKLFSGGATNSLFGTRSLSFLVHQFEAGIWFDSAERGRKPAGFGSWGAGIRLKEGPFFFSSIHGPGVISTTDSYLGSVPEFFHDISLGMSRGERTTLGFSYKHVSNAGLFHPNMGRDFLSFRVGFSF